ncbi:MAG: hypothetical protein GY894_04100 [Planctomycetes bacterium]|nr:hypothetical protein [Planctomycetota bacterium]MCP4838529.1 hypothetical protein [Planctomycetota bacterium]
MPRPNIFRRIAACAILSLAPTAMGQGLGTLPEIMKPEYFSRDLLLFIEGLNLTDEQAAISEMIFKDYERGFQAGLDGMNDNVTTVAETIEQHGDDKRAIVTAVLSPIQDWARERDVLGRQLIENIRIILDKDQQAAWTSFTRQLQREKHLPDGTLSGETTNIEHVFRDLNIQPAEGSPLAESFHAWDLALAVALIQRAETTSQGFNILEQIESDTANQHDIQRRRAELRARVEVRDINDATIEEMTALLGENGAAFRQEALKRGYGGVFRTTPVQRLFVAAIASEKVTSDASLLEAVNALYDNYLAELGDINLQLLATTRSFEPELESMKIDNRHRRTNGESRLKIDDPIRPLKQKRRELGIKYAQLLRDLLGDDIFATLDGAARFIPRERMPRDENGANPAGGSIKPSGQIRPGSPDDFLGKKRGGNQPTKPSGLSGGNN